MVAEAGAAAPRNPLTRPSQTGEDGEGGVDGALLFISDLHLSAGAPRTARAFEAFVAGPARDAKALFILGDLFELWVGDDMLGTPFAARVAAALRTLGEHGVAVYVMHGNRDFLLKRGFAAASGAVLLPDPTVLTAFGQRVVLSHGDALCTADTAYQRYRRVTRMGLVQRVFSLTPLAWRLKLAARLRARSEAAGPTRMAIADVTLAAVDGLFNGSAADLMIHGHTHRCARHEHGARVRWVLPDWDFDHDARGGYLQLDARGAQLLALDPGVSICR